MRALAREGMRQSAIAGCGGLTRTTVNGIHRGHLAAGTFVTVSGGSSEDHTSSRLGFVEDGSRGLLHKCLGFDGVDEDLYEMKAGKPSTADSCPIVTMLIDPQ